MGLGLEEVIIYFFVCLIYTRLCDDWYAVLFIQNVNQVLGKNKKRADMSGDNRL